MELREGLMILHHYRFGRFTADDYETYGGAETFDDDSPPFISDISNGDVGFVTIIDGQGMEITFTEDVNILDDDDDLTVRVDGTLEHCLQWLQITTVLKMDHVKTIRFILENFAATG